MSMPSLFLAPGAAPRPKAYAGPALLSAGFRPFYLLAAAASALMIPSWLLAFFGLVPFEPALPATLWHVHEMLFGYTAAVLVGFLYTAVPNWTGQPTPRGLPLAALAGVWLLGRVALLGGGAWPPALVIAIDVAFLPLAAIGIALPLWRTGNRRNIAFPFALAGLAVLNLCLHLAGTGLGPPNAADFATRGALGVVTIIVVIMTGRVVPAFTGNALPPRVGVNRAPRLDRLALGAVLASVVATAAVPETILSGATALAAGVLLVARMLPWKPLATLRNPMLWILHLGTFWIAVSFLLRGAFELGVPMQPSLADHALTVGAIGGLTLGMMARSALGHTGRKIAAGPAITACFVLINVAACARSLAALIVPSHFEPALVVAGVSWTLAFGIFFAVFVPILLAPRADVVRQA